MSANILKKLELEIAEEGIASFYDAKSEKSYEFIVPYNVEIKRITSSADYFTPSSVDDEIKIEIDGVFFGKEGKKISKYQFSKAELSTILLEIESYYRDLSDDDFVQVSRNHFEYIA